MASFISRLSSKQLLRVSRELARRKTPEEIRAMSRTEYNSALAEIAEELYPPC